MEAQRITRPLEATGARRQATLPSTMVRAEQIEKKFAADTGVFDLNFEVPTGTIFGMIGPSGCGKTTTVRLMTGLYKPDRGNLTVMNRANFTLIKADADQDGALAMLQSGQLDVVEMLPANMEQNLLDGKQSQVDFKYNEINPLNEQWVQYLAYAQVNEINRTVQTQAVQQMQADVMLRGRSPSDVTWLMLGIIAAVTFVGSSLLAHWRFRRLD